MGDGGAGDADHTSLRTIDAESGELLVVKGDIPGGNYEVLGPFVQSVFIRGRDGHEAAVSSGRRLHVIQASGLPEYWVDAAANADDSYYVLGVTTKDCTYCSLYVETNDAVVSFNGGGGDHFFVDVSAGQILLAGLDIPAGSTISGKNAVPGADYTNLRISVW